MGRISSFAIALSTAALCPVAAAQHAEHVAAPHAGQTKQDAYARGLYLLHNFEYDSAAQAFRAAQQADPGNVMAFWGEAMTFNHPLWAFQDAAAARAVLTRLGPTPTARRAKARAPREAMWLDAVEALYGDGDKVARDYAYHDRMRALFEADPNDVDARSFYALSTLGLAHQGRDTALYMQAAALLEEAFPTHQDHPGLLHYMIHSYDDPDHAPLGERAAARYAKVAPDAGHAQHMVSHIYLALGRWDAVESANLQAMTVMNAQRAADGRPQTYCGHYNEWLFYALDQQGKDSGALIDRCRDEGLATLRAGQDKSVLGGERNLFNNWATIAVRHGADTGQWPDWAAIPAEGSVAAGRFDLAYGRLLASRRDPAAAAAALADMTALRGRILSALPVERPDDHESAPWFERAVAQGQAIVALARGRNAEGLDLLRTAAQAEAALPKPFGPPILAKPSWELLGDELLAAGDKAGAAAAYREALKLQPGRRLSLEGLKKATS